MTTDTLSPVDQARSELRSIVPRGSTVYTILRHVSTSGMSRRISLVAFRLVQAGPGTEIQPFHLDHKAITAGVGKAPRPVGGTRPQGIAITGAGMDMGFSLVYDLALLVHGDGYALNHRWI